MSFYRNVAGLLLTSAVGVPIGFATSVVLARFLTPEDRGAYALAIAFATLLANFAQLGWASASVYRLRRMGSDRAQVVAAALLFMAVSSCVTLAIAHALQPWLAPTLLRGVPDAAYRLALGLTPFLLLGVVLDGVARGIDRFAISNWYRVLVLLATLGAAGVLLVWLSGGLLEMLEATLALRVVLGIGLVVAVVRVTGISARIRVDEIREAARFGVKNYATSMATRVRERADLFLIALFLDPAQVAFYAIAYNLLARIKTLTEALGQAAFPELAQLGDRAGGFACEVTRQSLLLVAVAAGGLALTAWFLVPWIFGAPYAASVTPLLILVPGLLFATCYRVLFRYFMAVDQQRYNIAAQNAALVTGIVASLVLIPRFGIAGAAVSSVCASLVEASVVIHAFRSRSGHGLAELLVPRSSDVRAYTTRAAVLWKRSPAELDVED